MRKYTYKDKPFDPDKETMVEVFPLTETFDYHEYIPETNAVSIVSFFIVT